MPETVYPYGWQAPEGNEQRSDFPAIYYSNLSDIAQKVIGAFDTKTSALAALGVSSSTPLWFTTTSPTTLWCLDSTGAHEVWTLGSGYTTGSFTMQDSDGNSIPLGTSTRTLRYRVEGAHVYGYGSLTIGANFSPPSDKFFWFPIPYPLTAAVTGLQATVGSVVVSQAGKNMLGSAYASYGARHVSVVVGDPAKGSNPTVMRYSTGSSGSAKIWDAGDTIKYNFDYERKL